MLAIKRLAAALLILALAACAKRESRPPVIVISIDTLRSDHVGAYGGRTATPNIDALARESLLCRSAWSHCPLTLPSHLSIFTGLLPPEHGVRDNVGYRFDAKGHPTLATVLKGNGYRTGAAVSAYVLRAGTGAEAGFDDYDDAIGIVDGAPVGALQRAGEVTERIAEGWIGAHEQEPFFYFLHLYEPHTPYTPTYDADVAQADALVGRFLGYLKARKLYERAVIVLLSDHGEGLGDHGEDEHGVFLYREALQVPLMIKLPGQAPRVLEQPVQLADVLPTVLDAVGIAPPAAIRGRSFLEQQSAPEAIYAESLYPRLHLGWSELRSVVRQQRQLIEAPRGELFDLHADPAERRNLATEDRRSYNELKAVLAGYGAHFTAPEAIDPEEAKKLAALGYVSAGAGEEGPLPDPKDRIADLARLKAIAALRQQGDPRAAIAAMEPLLAQNPRWSDLRDQLGAAYEAVGEAARAVTVYEGGITATPKLAGPFALSAATALLDLRRFPEAEAHARFAATAGAPGAHLLLGELALARGDLAAADEEAVVAGKTRSQSVHALFLKARVAGARHDYAQTVELAMRAREEQTRTGASLPRRFHYVLADGLAHLNRLPEAKREFEAEIVAEPHDVQAYADLALVQMIGGDRAGAGATLDRLIAADPAPEVARFAAQSRAKWGL
jgi:choline-sulfatase